MTCWNCRVQTPDGAFCRHCGAALPTPVARKAAINEEIAALNGRIEMLQSQIVRIDAGPQIAGAPAVVAVTPDMAPPTSPAITPATPATPKRSALWESVLGVEPTPAIVISLIGVVLLAAASLVSAKEHPALIGLSRSFRLSALIFELVLALSLTFFLRQRRTGLADAFGLLAWSALLSIGLLISASPATGLRSDVWTYALPAVVGATGVVASRRDLRISRLLSLGTLLVGIIHFASFVLHGHHAYLKGSNALWVGGLLLSITSLVATAGIYVAVQSRTKISQDLDRLLIGVASAVLWSVAVTTRLSTVNGPSQFAFGVAVDVLILGVFPVFAYRIARADSLLDLTWIRQVANAAVPISYLVFMNIPLKGGQFIFEFPASRWGSILHPLVYATFGLLGIWQLLRRNSLEYLLLGIMGLTFLPAIFALSAYFGWELTAHALVNDVTSWGADVGFRNVPSLVLILTAAAVSTPLFLWARTIEKREVRGFINEVAYLIAISNALIVVLSFSPTASTLTISTWSLIGIGTALFISSRWVKESAKFAEWLPAVLVLSGLGFSTLELSAHGDQFILRGVTATAIGLGIVAVLGIVTATLRTSTWHATAGWGVVGPALTGVSLIYSDNRLVGEIVMLGLGVVAAIWGGQNAIARWEQGRPTRTGLLFSALFIGLVQAAEYVEFRQYAMAYVLVLVAVLTVGLLFRFGEIIDASVLFAVSILGGALWIKAPEYLTAAGVWLALGTGALWLMTRTKPSSEHDSWRELGPAISFALIPTVVNSFRDSSLTPSLIVVGVCSAMAVVGLLVHQRALLEAGVVATVVISLRLEHILTWEVGFFALGVLLVIASTPRIIEKFNVLTGSWRQLAGAGVIASAAQLANVVFHSQTAVVLLMILIAPLVIALARRWGHQIEPILLLLASGMAGAIWSQGFDQIDGPGIWLAVGAVATIALLWKGDAPQHRSWFELGPGLLFAMIPANIAALQGATALRAGIVIGVDILLLAAAIIWKHRATFDVAAASFILLSVAKLVDVVSGSWRWVATVLVGIAMIGVGVWRDTRGRKQEEDASWWQSLT